MTAPFPGWLLRLANAATLDQAQAIARNALLAGATSGDVITALTDWDELQAKQVQRIGGVNRAFSAAYDAPHMPPAEKQPCLCSHHWIWHSQRCEISGCGCTRYRPAEVTR
jgi:hypothetical protein